MTFPDILLLAGAGLTAGAVNAAAGGGSLVSFPALVLTGLPTLSANVTNTVALSLGYAGGVAGFRDQLDGERARLQGLGAAAGLGSLAGVALIAVSSPAAFRAIVPWLLLASCLLLAVQPRVAERLTRRGEEQPDREGLARLSQVAAGAYGAYFGAGLGVMVLALLGMAIPEPLHRLNALKAVITLVVNAIAAACFILIAPVSWVAVAVLGPASLAGGRLGAALAKRVPARTLRIAVVSLGVAVAAVLLAT